MPLPWLSIIDGVLGATDIVRWARGRSTSSGLSSHVSGRTEERLAGVMVSALKEVFARDHERLEIERQRIEEEQARADRAMRLELLRQAGEREIGRLRLTSGVAVASWLGTLLLATRLTSGGAFPRVALGLGWALLLAALAGSFTGQRTVARALGRVDDRSPVSEVTAPVGAIVAPWLIVAGLALIALAVLFT